jgi:hypothetical protein
MGNEELHDFVEAHLGERLTKAEKRDLKKLAKLSSAYDIKQLNRHGKWRTQKSMIFRYSLTAVVSIALCLSIVLPISLGSAKTILVRDYIYVDRIIPPVVVEPIVVEPKIYAALGFEDTSYEELLEKGLLLFDDEQMFFGEYRVEINEEDSEELSYTISKCTVLVNENDVFKTNYRIRLCPDYAFSVYYDDYYATLVDIHDKYAPLIMNAEVLTINNVEKKHENTSVVESDIIDISVFNVGELSVSCTIIGDFAFIYFIYNGNGYFIKIEKDCEVDLDAKYIKNVFLAELFANIPN